MILFKILLLLQFEMFDRHKEQGLLSQYVNKKLIKNGKLNLFGRAITTIDLISQERWQVQTIMQLDLSHNSIQYLINLQQFCQLQILNISNNKIQQPKQLYTLLTLSHLHTLHLKNNPFLKNKLQVQQLQYLLSLNTDVAFMGSQVQQKITKLVSQTQLFHRYSGYFAKIKMHWQFFREKAVSNNCTYNTSNHLPKIKRLFQQNPFADKTLRKSIISNLDPSLFGNPSDLIVQIDKLIKSTKKKVSEEILQINQLFAQLSTKKIQTKKIQIADKTKAFKSTKTTNQWFQFSKPLRSKQNIKYGNSHNSYIKFSPTRSNSPQKSYVRRDKSTFDGEMQLSTIKLSQIQNQFTNFLTKIHPSFQLLHSPLPSLKSHQKDLLIEQLLNTLKDSFKSNLKLKTVQFQNNQLREQIKELKEHLSDITNQVGEQSRNLVERIKELQINYEQQLGRAQLLELQSKRRLLENELQKQVIDKFRQQTKVKDNQNQSLMKDIQHYEKVSQLRSNAIKKRHLHILMHKAHHYAKIKQLRQQTQNAHQNFIKQQVLYSFKLNLFLNYYQRIIQMKMRQRQMKNLLINNQPIFQNRQSQKQLMNSLKSFRIKSFLQKLKLFNDEQKLIRSRFQITTNKYRALKISYFLQCITNSITSKLSLKQQKRAHKHRKRFVLDTAFSSWINYIHLLKENQETCQRQYNLKIKLFGIQDFIDTMSYERRLNSKSLALHSFLPNIRKIKTYLAFTKKLSQILLKRSINVGKIKLQKKNQYLQYFISATKDRIVRKGLKKERQQQLKRIQQKQLENLTQNTLQKNKQIKLRFAKRMTLMASRLRIKILQRHISAQIVSEKMTKNHMTKFISKIRSFYIQHLRTNKKIAQIQNYRFNLLKCRKFFAVLGRFQQYKNNQTKKLRVLKMKVFYNWKIIYNQHSLIIFSEKYHQLQNEVERIKQQQLQNLQQKDILFRKLHQKDQLYHQCVKKCQELTFLLESKEIKYENLKNIFNQTQHINQYYKQKLDPLAEQVNNTKALPSKNKFLKCMQQQIRKDLTYEVQKLHTSKDRFLYQKDRNLQLKQKLCIDESRLQHLQKTQRFSFISSFKRF